MGGNHKGGLKAKKKHLALDPNYYSTIGKKSWADPNRNHYHGFAVNRELAVKMGKLTKPGKRRDKSDTMPSDETLPSM